MIKNKNGLFSLFWLIIIFLIVGFFIFIKFVSGATVHEELEDRIYEEKVRVIITLKQEVPKSFSDNFFLTKSEPKNNIEKIGLSRENIKHDLGSIVSAFITKEDLEKLRKNKYVESIEPEAIFHSSLQDATSIMNSQTVNNLLVNNTGSNLTGVGQTICIIDTGVNYTHPDLGGCFGNNDASSDCKIIGGYDYCADDTDCSTEDSDPIAVDDHGTHVSGIVAANGTITGIAPQAKIVMLKAGNSSGSFLTTDLAASINWCVNNASIFNISVISMSLGGDINYASSCDDNYATMATSINNAFSNNISVVISSGNNGNSSAISSPACITNATPVSSTDKADAISSFSNRNNLVKLFAAGSLINSTSLDGTYIIKSGTSMSAPMVAGAIAILNQYLNLSSQTKTPNEIEDILYDAGFKFNESINNYSRINIYNASLSLDVDFPNITLNSPANDSIDPNVNVTFVCNATDWQLKNSTLYLWNSSELYYNSSKNFTGTSNSSTFNVTNISDGAYVWNCLWGDVQGNSGYAISNYSLIVGGISVSLISPANNSHTNINNTNFSCESISESNYELSNVTFNLWNSSGDLTYNLTSDISGFDNITNFNYTFNEEGNYSWNCFGVNNVTSSIWASNNFSIFYDLTNPNITSLEESVSTTTSTITWSTNEPSNSSISGDISNGSSTLITGHSLSISGLSASTSYDYIVTSCDKAGNCANSTGDLTTSAITPSSGGGGGETSSIQSFTITEDELISSGGGSRSVSSKDKIIFDLDSGRHVLTIMDVTSNSAIVIIGSGPINLTLFIGEERKLNLSSSDYYDLYLILNSISFGKANISIRKINDGIYPEDRLEEVPEEDNVFHTMDESMSKEISLQKIIMWVVVAIIVIVLIFILIDRFIFYKKIREYMKKTTKELKRSKSLKRNGKNKKIKT